MKYLKMKLILCASLICVFFLSPIINAESSFVFYGNRIAQAVPSDSGAFFYSYLKNIGDETDTYLIVKIDSIPSGWFSVFCTDSLCLFDSVRISLMPGDSSSVRPEILPLQIAGDSKSIMRITSQNNLSDVKEITFRVATGYNLLLINVGDTENQYRSYYDDALSAQGINYNYWDKNFTTFLFDDLINFQTIILYSGDKNNDILIAEEITSIQNYLDIGNNAILTGQKLASSLDQSDLLNQYFGVEYSGNNNGVLSVNGIPDDVIGDGFNFDIFGGEGADNQVNPDVINAINSNPVFEYSNGDLAGARFTDTGFKTAFYSFGLEAVGVNSVRSDIISRTLNWFSSVTFIDDNFTSSPKINLKLANYPNPFNATTTIKLEVGSGVTSQDTEIEIYDIAGRLINSLNLTTANQVVWDGRDRFGNATVSGLYFYRVKSSDSTNKFSKMILIK